MLPVLRSGGAPGYRLGRVASNGHKTEYRLRCRAEIVLRAARGHSNNRIATATGCQLDTVRRWRDRFAEHGLGGLSDRSHAARPSSPRCSAPRPRRWPAGCRPRPACRCPAGAARSWPPN
ncbi:helix-turn-helix domain-containing protein [Streptomyces sp. NPDC001793]|uniref:helix-turn-helix domain-containing protein n=1 Tax=Streptomyces sp. NPDC001793 TaxID=3154657 RepID=UPI0033270C79